MATLGRLVYEGQDGVCLMAADSLAGLFVGSDVEIRRVRLAGGLAAAFLAGDECGLLTLSCGVERNPLTDREIGWFQRRFREAAVMVGRPVLVFRVLSQEVLRLERGRYYHAVKFAVYFGEQGRLFDE